MAQRSGGPRRPGGSPGRGARSGGTAGSARRQSAALIVEESSGEESNVEPMDVVLGVMLLIVIPFAMYLLLGFAGLPVSGDGGVSAEEALKAKERKAAERKRPVAFTKKEFDARWEYATRLVDHHVSEYRRLYAGTTDRQQKQKFYDYAINCMDKAIVEMGVLAEAVPRSPEIRSMGERVQRQLSRFKADRENLKKDDLIVN